MVAVSGERKLDDIDLREREGGRDRGRRKTKTDKRNEATKASVSLLAMHYWLAAPWIDGRAEDPSSE